MDQFGDPDQPWLSESLWAESYIDEMYDRNVHGEASDNSDQESIRMSSEDRTYETSASGVGAQPHVPTSRRNYMGEDEDRFLRTPFSSRESDTWRDVEPSTSNPMSEHGYGLGASYGPSYSRAQTTTSSVYFNSIVSTMSDSGNAYDRLDQGKSRDRLGMSAAQNSGINRESMRAGDDRSKTQERIESFTHPSQHARPSPGYGDRQRGNDIPSPRYGDRRQFDESFRREQMYGGVRPKEMYVHTEPKMQARERSQSVHDYDLDAVGFRRVENVSIPVGVHPVLDPNSVRGRSRHERVTHIEEPRFHDKNVGYSRFSEPHPSRGVYVPQPSQVSFPSSVPVHMPGSVVQTSNVSQSYDRYRKPLVLPDKFDGSVGWQDYFAHFELCADLNRWNPREKANYLAVSLRGPAQELLGDMSPEMRQNYFILVDNLSTRFGSEGQTELFKAQLKSRQRKHNESLPELAQALRRLIARSYPSAPLALRETLARDHFIDALLDMETRLRLKQNGPVNLDEAVRMAIELEAFQQAENERFSGKTKRVVRAATAEENEEHKILVDKIAVLEKQLEKLLAQTQSEATKLQKSDSGDMNKQNFLKKLGI